MPIPAADPKLSIMALVKDNWNAANVIGSTTPDFHTGWVNPANPSAQATFTNPDERAQGESGYGALSAGGPVQIFDGLLYLDFWACRLDGQPNPKALIRDMAMESRRIIQANWDAITGLEFIAIGSMGEVPPERDSDPIRFHYAATARYRWRTS